MTKSGPREDAEDVTVAEQVFRLGQRVARVRRQALEAQRSAADSLERSAVSHDRLAKSYEEIGRRLDRGDEYQQHMVRHRAFAREDRLMAEPLRVIPEIRWDDAYPEVLR